MTALIVGADSRVREQLRDQLQDRGMQVTTAGGATAAGAAVSAGGFHVAILDLKLADGSGLDVLRALRSSGSTAHVIVLSDSTSEASRVVAMDEGADDVVVKPFFVREMVARVLAVRRQRDPDRDRVLHVGRCDVDLFSRQVTCAGQVVELTANEFDLLAYLAVRPGHVFSREQLLHVVWHSRRAWQQPATVSEHIRTLRDKLEEDPQHPTMLITVRGSGYRLDLPTTDDAAPSARSSPVELGVIVHLAGRVEYADEAAHELFAVPSGATLVGREVLELVAPSSLDAAAKRLADADAGRPRRSEILQLRRIDGVEIAVEVATTATDWHGEPARRAQLTGVPEAPARLRQLVTGVLAEVADAVIITDLHFHIRSWNAAAERIYGWREDAVLGRHVLDVLQSPGGTGQFVEAADHLERSGRWNGEVVQATRDGSTVRILGSVTLLSDDRGEPVGVVAVNRPARTAGDRLRPEPDPVLVAQIERGITNDEFVVVYQPVVALPAGTLLTLEALVRWEHPERGLLGPAEFLDAAERSGAIVPLGELVLEKACRQTAEWRRGGADVRLSVNLSTKQLASEGVAERIEEIIQRTGFDPAHLWLEITETAVVEELDRASEVLRRLTALGAGVSIDDFGTGWASLTYLQNFPVHCLKVDGSFVAGLGKDETSTAIVRSILSLGAELELFVVAEGVETERQHKLLVAMGCTFGQGYFYGRPIAAADVPVERAARLPMAVEAEQQPAATPADAGRSRAPLQAGPGAEGSASTVAMLDETSRERRRSGPVARRVRPAVFAEVTNAESDATASLLRGLLGATSERHAVEMLQRTIRNMGGVLVPAADATEDALVIDVALGVGPAVLVEVEPLTVARMHLERLLPRLVGDARHAVDLIRRRAQLDNGDTGDATSEPSNHLDRVLLGATSGSIVMIHLEPADSGCGHASNGDVVSSFGRLLDDQVRTQDIAGRIGSEEFILVLADRDVRAAAALVDQIRRAWSRSSPPPVPFCAGIAAVGPDPSSGSLVAAVGALDRAKALGRNQTAVTHPTGRPTSASSVA